MASKRDRSPIGKNVERAARRESRQRHISIAQARANVKRSVAMRAYWTRARSYADVHKIAKVRDASRSAAFRRNEIAIKKATVREGASDAVQHRQAEKLVRALVRQGLNIGKGKTWRDYIRKRGRR